MKAHIIENNLVVNTIEVESLDFLPNLVDGSMGGIGWTFTDGNLMPPDEPQIPEETLWKNLREQRNRLLAETDWTANSDVTMSPEMAEYRKLLRDLPETVDINNPVYPEKPTGA
jgi:hypothetical protein